MYKATQLKTKRLNLKIGELETCICVPSDFWHFHLFLHLIMKCFTLVCIHCTTVKHLCISLGSQAFPVARNCARLGSDFVVNGARATRHPSRDVSSQAFPDFKNADLRATGKAWEPRLSLYSSSFPEHTGVVSPFDVHVPL